MNRPAPLRNKLRRPSMPAIPPAPTGSRARFCEAIVRDALTHGKRIVLYDGICLVCSWTINFITDHDKSNFFTFAPLQSELGAHIIARKDIPVMDSVLLIEPSAAAAHSSAVADATSSTRNSTSHTSALDESRWHCRSTAMLRIVAALHPRFLFGVLWLLLLLPAVLRDGAYKLFAAWRYRLFGTVDDEEDGEEDGTSCRPVTRHTRWRFLEYQLRDLTKQAAVEQKKAAAAAAAAAAEAAAAEMEAPPKAVPTPMPSPDSACVFAAAATVSASSLAFAAAASAAAASEEGDGDGGLSAAIRAQTDREMLALHGHMHVLARASSEEERQSAMAAVEQEERHDKEETAALAEAEARRALAAAKDSVAATAAASSSSRPRQRKQHAAN
jgi:predicted DCC family thiol-disulfide oxidoreductase YuxK